LEVDARKTGALTSHVVQDRRWLSFTADGPTFLNAKFEALFAGGVTSRNAVLLVTPDD